MSGQEQQAMHFLCDQFRHLDVTVERREMSDALIQDPDYSTPVPDIKYAGRFNLRITRRGSGGGKSLLFNTHIDVVPPSEGMQEPWAGRASEGVVFGRGACDAKGQIAALYLVCKALDALGAKLKGDVILHVVCEEENGGNGSLAMIRQPVESLWVERGEKADGCIVLEPSDNRLYTSIRGAVWFRIVFTGKAGHSGQAGKTRSALLMARDAMGILEKYHADLLARSRGFALFDPYPNPMPITFGKLNAGNWPAAAPSKAVLEGVLGLLPNKTKEQVCEEMRQALIAADGGALAQNMELSFMYRHDSSVLDPNHEFPQTILRAAKEAGTELTVSGMTASCDAWFYNNQLGIPTVVYGPGSLGAAHSKDEQIALADIGRAAEVLVRLTLDFVCKTVTCQGISS
jgi:acetylornithine deacetylase